MASFWKTEACGQAVLPDRSILKGQKMVENAKIEKLKCDILSDFQTKWNVSFFESAWGMIRQKSKLHDWKNFWDFNSSSY